MREGLKDGEVERQHRRCQLVREREAATRLLVVQDEELVIEREMSPQEQSLIVAEIVDFFILKMQGCLEASFRLKIIERFLEDERISLFLPQYYPHGKDAKVQFEFLKNYPLELGVVKGNQLADILARKAVIRAPLFLLV